MTARELTPELHEAIVAQIERGVDLATAAASEGIDPAEAHHWYLAGADPESVYALFRADVRQAAARAEGEAVASLLNAAKGGDSASAIRFLERRFPERWAQRPVKVMTEQFQAAVERVTALESTIGRAALHKVLVALAASADPADMAGSDDDDPASH